jgi:hypothetical protein
MDKSSSKNGHGLRIIVPALVLLLLLFSCKEKNEGEHLPPELMQKVLLDVNIAETYSTMVKDSLYKNGAKNLDSLASYYKQIFAHHHITQQQFNKSLDYYKAHIDEFDTLYNKMQPIIERMQTANTPPPMPPAPPPPPAQ